METFNNRTSMYTFHQIGLDFVFCTGSRSFPRASEPEVEGRRHLPSEKYAGKSSIVHPVCVIIMNTIYEMYTDGASSRSSYAVFLECRGSLLLLVM